MIASYLGNEESMCIYLAMGCCVATSVQEV
jgi:hypothetical protein